MKKVKIPERPAWRTYAESVGFKFHTFDGEPYWDETGFYQFSLQQIEQHLESPTEELHQMVMSLIPEILSNEQQLRQLDVPELYWDWLADSWKNQEPYLYGRLDLSYNGTGPAKLLELNYDTPTSLYESGFFQWVWLEDQIACGHIPARADQFNSLQEKLEQRFNQFAHNTPLYFTCVADNEEDRGTVHYLEDIARQASLETCFIPLADIGEIDGQLVDVQNYPIQRLFKLYPWEFMLREEFGKHLLSSKTQWLEPAWKMLISNKGILPLLWQKFPNHPNLLPAFFDQTPQQTLPTGWVRKPLYSREGANIELCDFAGHREQESGPYSDSGFIRQAFAPLPKFDNSYTLVGSWLVGEHAAGICIREDATLITKDSSRFLPHIILD